SARLIRRSDRRLATTARRRCNAGRSIGGATGDFSLALDAGLFLGLQTCFFLSLAGCGFRHLALFALACLDFLAATLALFFAGFLVSGALGRILCLAGLRQTQSGQT